MIKNIAQALALGSVFATSAFAGTPAAVGAKDEKPAAVAAKVTHKVAKEACLKDNPALKGKELRECIKTKKKAQQ